MIVSECQLSMIEMQGSRRPVILENDVSVEIVLRLAVRMNIESMITHHQWRIHTIIYVLYLCMLCFQLCKPYRKRRFHIGIPSLANALDLLYKRRLHVSRLATRWVDPIQALSMSRSRDHSPVSVICLMSGCSCASIVDQGRERKRQEPQQ